MDVAILTAAALALPFLGALAAPLAVRLMGDRAVLPLALLPAAVFLHFSRFYPEVARGEIVTGGFDWIPSYNVSFSWLVDGLSLTFVQLISGIGSLVVLYAGGYLKGHADLGRFLGFLFAFMGAMLGLVVSDSFLMLFVFWELTSITSFLLIGFDHGRERARRAALQALVITGGGGLMLLAGLILLWNVSGVTQFSALTVFEVDPRASPFYLAILLLVLGGAFTKSAQFPFHAWLPNAMEAPTPVSAYLHSATMVKAGVYLLMRLQPTLGGTMAWEIILPLAGGATLIAGAVLAVAATDLKRMLAYTTMASLGLLVLLTGLGSPHAIEAAALYLIAHSLFKGALFMVAGIIDHETGMRDATRLSGLRRAMPVTFAAALLAALSMAGLPPFFGFLAKEEIYTALAAGEARSIALAAVVLLGNALMAAVAYGVGVAPFLGARLSTPRKPHEAPPLLLAGPVVLALAGLAAAVLSAPFHAAVTTPMAGAIAGAPRAVTISLAPHLGVALLLSVATLVLAAAAVVLARPLRRGIGLLLADIGWGPDRGFDQAMQGLLRVSVRLTRRLQAGRLELYLTVTFAALACLLLATPAVFGEWPALPAEAGGLALHEWAIIAIALLGLAGVLVARDRLTAIVSLGIQGFAVAVIFLLYGAPDLAFTQFMIETLSVVILALVMTRLDLAPSDRRPPRERIPDIAIALACGIGLTMLLWSVLALPLDARLSEFFAAYAKTVAHGANIVNVIIVDFRGVDTLGEIAVVMMAAVAILSLIRLRPLARIADNDPEREDD
ncbi:putative monovalent cation/H+ antiporter subunit A [Ensifer soli]|uniref:putative monovalent cation/H+ antiporter subunit A n=1 Tax=Ciceribacter sp. sgz301302 TaxID=3342379 RepID=UPI0035BA9370